MFYNSNISVFKKVQTKDEFNQLINKYVFSFHIDCDVQPSTAKLIKETFGDSTESLFIVFTDNDIELGTVVKYNNNVYKINSKIDWVDYKIYSLIGCDADVG